MGWSVDKVAMCHWLARRNAVIMNSKHFVERKMKEDNTKENARSKIKLSHTNGIIKCK